MIMENGLITILIVDDDAVNRRAMTHLLIKSGFTVIEAESGRAAFSLIGENRPDLILVDVVLGDEDGFEVARKFKESGIYGNPIVILVSGVKTGSRDKSAGLDLGADGYITRPFNNREFLSYINAFARLKQAEIDLKKLHREKETLFRELQHRVTNNYSLILSLFNTYIQKEDNELIRNALLGFYNRVQSIAHIHKRMNVQPGPENGGSREYFDALVGGLKTAHFKASSFVHLHTEIDNCPVPESKLIYTGLILNEVITNSLKYAFPEPVPGARIEISFTCSRPGTARLSISDNGVGFDDIKAAKSPDSLGMSIVKTLAEDQLEGTLTVSGRGGTTVTVEFPYLS